MIDKLVERVEEAQHELSNVYSSSEEGLWSSTADELIERIPQLFDKIAHGEPGHREWLKKAIEAHFLGEPMPEYVAK